MIKIMILSISNMININFINLNHPMSMMMMIIIQTFLFGLMTGLIMESFWLSYILFLTFLGGMLVLFIYITSITSNEMFKLKSIIIIFMMMVSMIMMIMLIIINKTMFIDLFKNNETMNMNKLMFFQEMSMSLIKLYNKPMFITTMMMMVYLFLTLLAIVMITNIYQGPLRKIK